MANYFRGPYDPVQKPPAPVKKPGQYRKGTSKPRRVVKKYRYGRPKPGDRDYIPRYPRRPSRPIPGPVPGKPNWWVPEPIKYASPYVRLLMTDPQKTLQASRQADAWLTQYMPEWYYQDPYFGLGGGWGAGGRLPAQPARYDTTGWTLMCNIVGPPYTAMSWGTLPSGSPQCELAGVHIPTGNYGTAIPGTARIMLYGVYTLGTIRMDVRQHWERAVAGQPVPFLPPVPIRYIPGFADPNADPLPEGFNDPLNWPAPDPLPAPAPIGRRPPAPAPADGGRLPPFMVPAVTMEFKDGPNGPSLTIKPRDTAPNLPPPGGPPDEKWWLKGFPGGPTDAAGNLAGGISEFKDFVDTVADNIPTGVSPRAGPRIVPRPCKGLPLHEKTVCIIANAKNADWDQVWKDLIANEVFDQVAGRGANLANRNFEKKGYIMGGRGPGSGPSKFATRW